MAGNKIVLYTLLASGAYIIMDTTYIGDGTRVIDEKKTFRFTHYYTYASAESFLT